MAVRGVGVFREPPRYGALIFGVVGLLLLILSGGGHTPLAFGLAAFLPGMMLLIWPPKTGLGIGVRYSFLAFMACMLLAFLPQFYWSTAEWRLSAVETYGIDLPGMLSIQPRVSLEGCILLFAGFAWFSVLANADMNSPGFKWVLFSFSLMTLVLASIAVYGSIHGIRYVMAEHSQGFSFFPNRNQMANFLSVAGIVSFGFSIEGIRHKRALHLVGLLASGLCLFALILGMSRAGIFLYFLGVSLVLILQFFKLKSGVYLKLGIPLLLLAFTAAIVARGQSFDRMMGIVSAPAEFFNDYRMDVFADAWAMTLDAPLTGVGAGNFAAIFPQYQEASISPQAVIHPESDLFWLMTEGGILALLCLAAVLFFYARICFSKRGSKALSYRPVLFVALLIFGLHSIVDVSAHRPGTAYVALLIAALLVPRGRKQTSCFQTKVWRVLGLGFMLIGSIWMGSYVFGWRLHSTELADQQGEQVDGYIQGEDYMRATDLLEVQLKQRPLDWRLHHQRGQLALHDLQNRKLAAESFRAARFVQPNHAVVCVLEGKAWLPYDLTRAVGAWRESLFRESKDQMKDFDRMVKAGLKNPLLLDRLSLLSELEPKYRVHFLTHLEAIDFQKELRRELERDPGLKHFTNVQRSEIVKHWINYADLDTVEAFIAKHEAELDESWQLWALLRKSQARFKEAVEIIRESVTVPLIPEVDFDENELPHIERGFAVVPSDLSKGTGLLNYYLQIGDLEKALLVSDKMANLKDAPLYAIYWKAEVLYLMEDYIESWYAFERYMHD